VVTFYLKHHIARELQCFRNVVASFLAKMRFRPQGGIAFLPPDILIRRQNLLHLNWLGMEIFKIKKKSSILRKSITE
jgi:hypothetical protein